MTKKERKEIGNRIFGKKEGKPEAPENIISVAVLFVPFLFCWWADWQHSELEVFENEGKQFYTTTQRINNYGHLKLCNIPKNCCQKITE